MDLLSHIIRAAGTVCGRRRPIYAHYGVTHRCNMRCRMCAVWQSGDAARELTPEQVQPLAAELRRAGVLTVALGGGEPFVRADLPELVEAFSRRGIAVRVLTNGIHISEALMDAALAAGMRHVSVSLDSLDPAKEKEIYNGQEVWAEIVQTMRRIRRKLPRRGTVPIMNVCVSRLNLKELPQLAAFARDLGFFCSFVPIALAPAPDASDGFAAYAPELAVRPEDRADLEAAYAALLRLKKEGAPIANTSRFLRDSLRFLLTGRGSWTCDAGRLYLSISPEGGISVCHRFPPFADWAMPDWSRRLTDPAVARTMQAQRSQCAGCMRPCWAEVTHAFHHLPSSWETLRLFLFPPPAPANDRKASQDATR
jgi:MoaA/NifB/PqqE/SkfB family radical SAM enzyme